MTAPGIDGPTEGVVLCEYCGKFHRAEYHHDGSYGEGPIYAVWAIDCPRHDLWLRPSDGTPYEVDYFTKEGLWYL